MGKVEMKSAETGPSVSSRVCAIAGAADEIQAVAEKIGGYVQLRSPEAEVPKSAVAGASGLIGQLAYVEDALASALTSLRATETALGVE